MPRSEVGRSIQEIVKRDLAVRLTTEGFRRNAWDYHRVAADHTAVVNVQLGKWNAGAEGTFAINLGVYFPIAAALGAGPIVARPTPKEYECTMRERLGMLAHGRDHWWEVTRRTDAATIAHDVADAWSTHGRPWIERVSTLAGAYEEARLRQSHFLAAILALALENREAASMHLQDAVQRLPRGRARFLKWGAQHGLLTPG